MSTLHFSGSSARSKHKRWASNSPCRTSWTVVLPTVQRGYNLLPSLVATTRLILCLTSPSQDGPWKRESSVHQLFCAGKRKGQRQYTRVILVSKHQSKMRWSDLLCQWSAPQHGSNSLNIWHKRTAGTSTISVNCAVHVVMVESTSKCIQMLIVKARNPSSRPHHSPPGNSQTNQHLGANPEAFFVENQSETLWFVENQKHWTSVVCVEVFGWDPLLIHSISRVHGRSKSKNCKNEKEWWHRFPPCHSKAKLPGPCPMQEKRPRFVAPDWTWSRLRLRCTSSTGVRAYSNKDQAFDYGDYGGHDYCWLTIMIVVFTMIRTIIAISIAISKVLSLSLWSFQKTPTLFNTFVHFYSCV